MKYEIRLSDNGRYVIVTSFGDLTRFDGAEMTRAMYALGASSGVNCFLADARKARNIDGPVASVRFVLHEIPEVPGQDPTNTHMALLVDPADHSHDFYAAFSQTHGIDIALFWDYDEAVRYLEERSEQTQSSAT